MSWFDILLTDYGPGDLRRIKPEGLKTLTERIAEHQRSTQENLIDPLNDLADEMQEEENKPGYVQPKPVNIAKPANQQPGDVEVLPRKETPIPFDLDDAPSATIQQPKYEEIPEEARGNSPEAIDARNKIEERNVRLGQEYNEKRLEQLRSGAKPMDKPDIPAQDRWLPDKSSKKSMTWFDTIKEGILWN